jgi:hypothetical protein
MTTATPAGVGHVKRRCSPATPLAGHAAHAANDPRAESRTYVESRTYWVLVLNIVILHCHFERGGVTQVVENHIRALRDGDCIEQIVLVAGKRTSGLSAETLSATKLIQIDDFDYDAQDHTADALAGRSGRIAQQLAQQLSAEGITSDNSVLHWHNHGLGKNTAAPEVIRQLVQAGWRALIQIHDFAEDNRPENYRRLITASGATSKTEIDRYLYPVASQIHYATLTRADAAILTKLGIPSSRTHCLPNSVVLPSGEPEKADALAKVRHAMELPADASWCLYPVRGIRRKNVGEFLMLSRWIRPNQFAGLTLCPSTPIERRSYERWKALAVEVAPRAVFDAGHDPDVGFGDNIAASDFILSTSVAEGFGMAFLEPWLAHREVIARRLHTVTDDFEECGVRFPKLYDAVNIPGDQQWLGRCRQESAAAADAAWSTVPEPFRPPLGPEMNDRPEMNDNDDHIDFAYLTPGLQVDVLRRLAADSGFESSVKELSRSLVDALTTPPDARLIQENGEFVAKRYSPEQTGNQLVAIYQQLCNAPSDRQVESPAHAGIAVELISGARPIYPCRTELIDV